MLYNRAQPTVLSLLTCFQFSNIVRPLGGCGVKIQNVNANYLAKVKSNTWLETVCQGPAWPAKLGYGVKLASKGLQMCVWSNPQTQANIYKCLQWFVCTFLSANKCILQTPHKYRAIQTQRYFEKNWWETGNTRVTSHSWNWSTAMRQGRQNYTSTKISKHQTVSES